MELQAENDGNVLHIDELAAGGRGLARAADGRVVFVRGALAGETVEVALTARKKDYAEAVCLRVLEASPERVRPACPAYGACGGCDLMHLAYAGQLEAKLMWTRRALRRLPDMVEPTLWASPEEWGWRNRVRFQVRGNLIGFFERGGRRLEPLTGCPVAHPAIDAVLAGLAPQIRGGKFRDLAWVEVLADGRGGPFVTMGLSGRGKLDTGLKRELRQAGRQAGAAMVRLCRGADLEKWDHGDENGLPYYIDEPLRLMAYPGLFCQVNLGVNQRLLQLVQSAAADLSGGAALDLFAGSGNFALLLAKAGWRVSAVEESGEAVQVMLRQARQADLLERLDAHTQDAGEAVEAMSSANRRFDLLVLDPPRAGAKGLTARMAAMEPRRIIYISCHPAALARDAQDLCALGYRPSALHVLDMFPQTSHLETMLVLDRP